MAWQSAALSKEDLKSSSNWARRIAERLRQYPLDQLGSELAAFCPGKSSLYCCQQCQLLEDGQAMSFLPVNITRLEIAGHCQK